MSDDDIRDFIENNIIQAKLGIYDATEKEIELLISNRANSMAADYILADMISRRAQIGVTLVFLRC